MQLATRLHGSISFLLLAVCGAQAATLWDFQTGGRLIGRPTIYGESIHVAGGSTLYALDREGRERWQKDLGAEIASGVSAADGRIYVHAADGLHVLDEKGQSIWSYENFDEGPLVDGRSWGWGNGIYSDPWGWCRSAPLLLEQAVVFGSSDGVHAVARENGEALWQVPIGPITADVVSYGEQLIVASWNNSVYALQAEDGKLLWRFRAPTPPTRGVDWIGYEGFHLTPIVEGDRIYVGNRGMYFYALDARHGTEDWSIKVGSSWIGSPAIVAGEQVFNGLSDGMAVLGHATRSGSLEFFFQTGSPVFAQPQLHGERLIVGSLGGDLFALDLANGDGSKLLGPGQEEFPYADFFDPEKMPEGLSPYEQTQFIVDRLRDESSSILNLTVEADVAYLATASGKLIAFALDGES